VADILVTALTATTPQAGSKAKYMIDAGVAEACRARCADLLARHPLYPQIQL
jgi:glycine hydroxymethyltransferase